MPASRSHPTALPCLLAIILCGCSSSTSASITGTPEGKAVDAFLRRHLNDPNYEAIRFWPAIDSPKALDAIESELRSCEESIASNRELRGDRAEAFPGENSETNALEGTIAVLRSIILNAKDGSSARACRLRYRAKNDREALVLFERIYVVDIPGRVVYLMPGEAFDALAGEFPE